MAVNVKPEPAFTAVETTSGDESSVTAVTYNDETPSCAHGQECSSCSAQQAASSLHRSPEEILRLTTEDKFFQPCPSCSQYRVGRDVQLTFFDLAQGKACCSVCKHTHAPEAVLQVRRSSYHDVVRVNEVTKIFDISTIQPYWINNDRVVFLRPRPQPRPPRGCSFPAACTQCNRQLMDAHASFCSLQCKLRGSFGLTASDAPPAAPLSAPATSTSAALKPVKAATLLPHWGKMRRRSHPQSDSSGSDGKSGHDNDVHTHGCASSDDEVEGGSVEKFQGLVSVMFSTGSHSSSSRKRKQPPCRSPFE